jgi:hypothetical protein
MKRALAVAILLGILNFAAFIVGTFVVGGDAVNGASSCPAGQHYLWDKTKPDHCRQVSDSIYWYSKIHAYSVIVSWPIIIVAVMYLNRGSFAGELTRRLKALPSHKRREAWSRLLDRAKNATRTATSDEDMNRLVDQSFRDLDSREEKK